MPQHIVKARRNKLGQRADLRETFGYELQALHVFAHVLHEVVGRISLFKDFNPCHKTRYRCAKLVRRFLRQAHPHLVLLRLFGCQQGKDGYHHKQQYNAKLHIRVSGKALEHHRVIVTHVDIFGLRRVADGNFYVPPVVIETPSHRRHGVQTVGGSVPFDIDIAESLHLPFRVEHDYGDGVVLVYHLEHKVKVGSLVGDAERAHGLRPHLHLAVLLLGEVSHKDVGHDKRHHRYYHGSDNEEYLHLAYSVCPLHI